MKKEVVKEGIIILVARPVVRDGREWVVASIADDGPGVLTFTTKDPGCGWDRVSRSGSRNSR
uniref:Uncharacterized protein n=1 Tax=Candidatus Kentrum sp. TC TaxID=2126339 RepID=A0A450YRV0_9GAMM|nr:MAG: hypothetical protein BECKTC1821E_GA0114239_103322 [Candidatus Kentron sp. TC]